MPPDRPDNLWEPASGAWGAHGTFDDVARGRSVELWLREHAPLVAVGGAVLVGVALSAVLRGDGSGPRHRLGPAGL